MSRAWALVALLTAVALAGCADVEEIQEFGTVEVPAMGPGFAYAYDIEGSAAFDALVTVDGAVVEDESDTISIERQPMVVYEILNTSFGPEGAFYIGAAQFAGAPDDIVFGDLESSVLGKLPLAIRKADLAPFAVSVTQAQECDPGCRLATTGVEVSGETPLDPYLEFPLEAGKSWNNDIDLGFGLEDLGLFLRVSSTVVGMESVEGPDGPVDAVRIVHTLSLPGGADLIDAMEQAMEANGLEDASIEFDLDGGIETFYAPSLHNVVQEVATTTIQMAVSFTQDGQRIDTTVTAASDVRFLLAAADLEAGSEHDEEALFAFFDGGRPVKTPGEPVQAGAYAIEVTASAAEFDLADTDTISFDVAATPGLPEGDTIRHSVSDASGGRLADGVGDAFDVTFSEPGLYHVRVQAINPDGIVQAEDAMLVAADYTQSVDLTCGQAIVSAVPGSGSCTDAHVPITSGVGLQAASITISSDNPLATGGTLTVTDGEGNSVSTEPADGDGFTLAELEGLTIGPDGWTVSWSRDVALLEEASIDIVLDYGPETESENEAGTGDGGLALRMLEDQLERVAALDGLAGLLA